MADNTFFTLLHWSRMLKLFGFTNKERILLLIGLHLGLKGHL